ncbi:sensor domain-containing diguanylate cyclase [Motilibacter deserti]|uniref:Sensor domain-containing diguanylate cyclase n=1 Tax=Motilibacter deserti TaxID=2714956 RepID=A0ABX0GUV5_9ACTN|nr:sensor domain-containing diguanylate cyclase [Motilibacter deserti]NHC14696.1 sensor domain-containing diguanylate cyclase [Motilibacter deserti]
MADKRELFDVVVEFARRATGAFTVEGVLRDLAAAACRVLPVTGAGVMYVDGRRLRFVDASSDSTCEAETAQDVLGQGPCHDAVDAGEAVLEPDLAVGAWRWPEFADRAVAVGMRSVASVPLLARGRAWGALDLYRSAPSPWSEEDLEAARTLADVAVSYVVMAHDRDEAEAAQDALVHAATHDALTGLPNRALLYDRLEHALASAQRRDAPLAVLFLDLNGFKAINDTHGHEVGDQVLVEAAGRLGNALRTEDTLARLGGDEFVILCESLTAGPHGTISEHALAVVTARVRAALEAPLHVAGHDVVLRASIGVATAGPGFDDPDALLRAADSAMYREKVGLDAASWSAQEPSAGPRPDRRGRRRIDLARHAGAAVEAERLPVAEPLG